MNFSLYGVATCVPGLVLFCVVLCSSPVHAIKPNIVLILADDLGYGDLGCYGNRRHQTPHIDALADTGLRFIDFHSAGAMCTPTRAATLTGQYQQRFGSVFDSAISGVRHRDLGLPHQAITVAELLRGEGYATGCFGKWHLGFEPPWLPNSHGFDQFRGLGSGDGDYHSHVDRSGNPDWWSNEQLVTDEGYTTELLTRYSTDFIQAHRDQPFFLYVPHLAIHFPWQGPNDPSHRREGVSYHDDKWCIIPEPNNVAPHIKSMVESLDSSVGGIVASLEKYGIRSNTLVIFTSDNGGYLNYGEHFHKISSNGVLRGQKTELYEGGHRVPTIMSWPGRIQPGSTDSIGHSVDLLPTMGSLAGIDITEHELDGLDLGPLLFDSTPLPQRMLFWRAGSRSAVRQGNWKLIRNDGKIELYELAQDLSEKQDVSSSHTARVARMTSAWSDWEDDVNASATRMGR